MKAKLIRLALAAGLAGCSTMDVTLEKTSGNDGPAVSVVAKAPNIIPIKNLIAEANRAMAQACLMGQAGSKNDKGRIDEKRVLGDAVPDEKRVLGDAVPIATEIKEVLKELRSWFPENTYTAARKCK